MFYNERFVVIGKDIIREKSTSAAVQNIVKNFRLLQVDIIMWCIYR